MHKQAGTSLIELLIALAVLALLAATALAPLQELAVQRRADSAVAALRADLDFARTVAIMNGRSIVLCPRTESDACSAQMHWMHGWVVQEFAQPGESGAVLRVGALGTGDRLALRSNRRQVRYRSDGTSAGSNQTIRVCVNGRQRAALVINNGGRPRSERTVPHTPC